MEIAPGVHRIGRLLGSDMHLIAEDQLTVIDPGMRGSRRSLMRYLRTIGRSIDELACVVLTHGHFDHVDGTDELVGGRDDVEVLMHGDDIAGLRRTLLEALAAPSLAVRRGNLIQYLTRLPNGAKPVQDGDLLPVLGGLEVIHTPGHTPGSICLFASRHRLLFTGDALEVVGGRLAHANAICSHDMDQARAGIARLCDFEVEAIALAHYPIWRDRPLAHLRSLIARATRG